MKHIEYVVAFIGGAVVGKFLIPALQHGFAAKHNVRTAHPATHACTGRCDPHVCDDGECPDTGCGVLHPCVCDGNGNCHVGHPVTVPLTNTHFQNPTNPFAVPSFKEFQ